MRYLRMLTNSLLAGALGAAYLTILVLQLNPQMPLVSRHDRGGGSPRSALFYGVHLAVVFYLSSMLAASSSRSTRSSPGWVSVRILAWLACRLRRGRGRADVAQPARASHGARPTMAARRMTAGAIATTAARRGAARPSRIAHYSFGRRGSRVGASLFVIAAFASLALPLAARGPGVASSDADRCAATRRRRTAAATGTAARVDDPARRRVARLHAAARRRRAAAGLRAAARDAAPCIDLATIRPTQPEPVWAAVATGKYPPKNGVRSAASSIARER